MYNFQGSSNRKKKPCSFQEALADLELQGAAKKKQPYVSFFEQKKDCTTGHYITKPRKVYHRKKAEPHNRIEGMKI